MILSDLPFAHETAEGADEVAFYNTEDANRLASLMEEIITGEKKSFGHVSEVTHAEPYAASWKELFDLILAG
jgi:hypothetical protein